MVSVAFNAFLCNIGNENGLLKENHLYYENLAAWIRDFNVAFACCFFNFSLLF